jgi:hypothetical protein
VIQDFPLYRKSCSSFGIPIRNTYPTILFANLKRVSIGSSLGFRRRDPVALDLKVIKA